MDDICSQNILGPVELHMEQADKAGKRKSLLGIPAKQKGVNLGSAFNLFKDIQR